MKVISLLALLFCVEIVKGTWWTAAVQPVILSLGAILGAVDLDVLDIQLPVVYKKETRKDRKATKERHERIDKTAKVVWEETNNDVPITDGTFP